MSAEIKEVVKIAIDMMLLSILVLMVSFFGSMSKDALNFKTIENASMHEIKEYQSIYEYTRGKKINKSVLDGDEAPHYTAYNSYVMPSATVENYLRQNGFNDFSLEKLKDNIDGYRTDISKGRKATYPEGLLRVADIANFMYNYPLEYNVIIKDELGSCKVVLPRIYDLERVDWYTRKDILKLGSPTDCSVGVLADDWTLNFLGEALQKAQDSDGIDYLGSFYYAYAVYDDFAGLYESIIFVRVAE